MLTTNSYLFFFIAGNVCGRLIMQNVLFSSKSTEILVVITLFKNAKSKVFSENHDNLLAENTHKMPKMRLMLTNV